MQNCHWECHRSAFPPPPFLSFSPFFSSFFPSFFDKGLLCYPAWPQIQYSSPPATRVPTSEARPAHLPCFPFYQSISDLWLNRRLEHAQRLFWIHLSLHGFYWSFSQTCGKERNILVALSHLWIFSDTTVRLDKWSFPRGERQCGVWNHVSKWLVFCCIQIYF